MKTNHLFTLLAAVAICVPAAAQNIIPQPRSLTLGEGSVEFTPRARVYCTDAQLTDYLRIYFPKAKTVAIENNTLTLRGRRRGAVVAVVITENETLPAEGYRLTINAASGLVMVKAASYAGAFNGVQTLLQLFPDEVYNGRFKHRCTLPALTIDDWPQFGYRGQHFDVARTFSTVDEVLRFIDNLSHFKINRLHWHLTDDEGWRIEIKSHPELAATGGFRGGDSPIEAVYGKYDQKYGGYYTQDEVRQIVDYAAARNIEIIPEIDLPGHSSTIAKIHPEIVCPYEVDNTASLGVDQRNVWCVAREENYALLDDILREVAALFPSPYLHVGGDEVDMSQWKQCPHCSALYAAEGFTDYHQLEGLFMCRMSDILARYGKSAAVWSEAINGGNLPKQTLVHGWIDFADCGKSTADGFPTIIMPSPYFYFDMAQSPDEPGMRWAAIFDVMKTYSLDLSKAGFTPEQLKNVVGYEGAFWTEIYLYNKDYYPDYLEYQVFPRVLAAAELGWTPDNRRDAADFERRLKEGAYPKMDAMGIHYRAAAPEKVKETLLTPAMTFTSSMPFRRATACEQISAYQNDFGHPTARTCHDGDYLLFTFDNPLTCGKVRLITGYRYMARSLFPSGYVELSYDGVNFSREAELYNGRVEIENLRGVKAIRMVSTSQGNGNPFVYIQYPEIIK